jgi:hypothetical protein
MKFNSLSLNAPNVAHCDFKSINFCNAVLAITLSYMFLKSLQSVVGVFNLIFWKSIAEMLSNLSINQTNSEACVVNSISCIFLCSNACLAKSPLDTHIDSIVFHSSLVNLFFDSGDINLL